LAAPRLLVVAGARRTSSSLDRLRSETLAYDHGIAIDAPGAFPEAPESDRYDDETVRSIERLPEVAAVGGVTFYIGGLPDTDWEFTLAAAEDATVGSDIERDLVVRGRPPRVESATEVAINEAAALRAHVDVGDSLHLLTLTPEQRMALLQGDEGAFDSGPLGPALDLEIVGVLRGASDVTGRAEPSIFATAEFDRTYRGRVAYSTRVLFVRRAPGTSDEQLHADVDHLASHPLGTFDATTDLAPVRHTLAILTDGLVVLAAVGGAVAALVVGLAAGRQARAGDVDQTALAAVGFTRGQRVVAMALTTAPAALLAVVVGVAGSVAASPLMPIGLARRVDPDLGLSFDPLVAAGLVIATLVTFGVAALLSAALVTREARGVASSRRPSVLVPALGSAGAAPVTTVGVGFAVDRGRPTLPTRSAFAGTAAAVMVIIAAVTFWASLDRLTAEPARWGFTWDLMIDASPAHPDADAQQLRDDSDLAGVSLLSSNFTLVEGDGTKAYGLAGVSGDIGYALSAGVQPSGADEVVIGPRTAELFHVGVGSTLDVAVCPCTGEPATTRSAPVRVVGVALFPEDDDGNFTNALGFSGDGFTAHVGADTAPRWAIRVAPRTSVSTVASRLDDEFPGQVSAYSFPRRPGDVENLTSLRGLAPVVVAFTSVLAAAALANVLYLTVRRRRIELATLRTLGLTPRQAGFVMLWQSATITVAAVALGLPAGALVGARVWGQVARTIDVGTSADRPLTLWLLPAIALLVAAAVSAPIAWRASRLRLAHALRTA
jgi:hypothetical protein